MYYYFLTCFSVLNIMKEILFLGLRIPAACIARQPSSTENYSCKEARLGFKFINWGLSHTQRDISLIALKSSTRPIRTENSFAAFCYTIFTEIQSTLSHTQAASLSPHPVTLLPVWFWPYFLFNCSFPHKLTCLTKLMLLQMSSLFSFYCELMWSTRFMQISKLHLHGSHSAAI